MPEPHSPWAEQAWIDGRWQMAVESVTGFTGGGRRNSAQMFLSLKPRDQRAKPRGKPVVDCDKDATEINGVHKDADNRSS